MWRHTYTPHHTGPGHINTGHLNLTIYILTLSIRLLLSGHVFLILYVGFYAADRIRLRLLYALGLASPGGNVIN